MRTYNFKVRLCDGNYCIGFFPVRANNQEEARIIALDSVCNILAIALPTLDIPVDVEEGETELSVKEKRRIITDSYYTDFTDMNGAGVEFYYHCLKNEMDLPDADDYAILNRLFGYDIGIENALEISSALFNDYNNPVTELLTDKRSRLLLELVNLDSELGLDFSKWGKEFESYDTYYIAE